ncbi:exported hypothetical protein [Candidatus Sulfopaludibacter sp. SbA3]|nr:exported hypothetical protein [Candidatus Sulfopaludibacter sp. SbA3]
MNRALQLAGALLLVAWPGWSADQKDKPAAPPKAPPRVAAKAFNGTAPKAGGGIPKKNVPHINNPGLAQRLLQMTPEQRERALEKLDPPQQAQLRQALERLDRLPQADKDRIARQARSASRQGPDRASGSRLGQSPASAAPPGHAATHRLQQTAGRSPSTHAPGAGPTDEDA